MWHYLARNEQVMICSLNGRKKVKIHITDGFQKQQFALWCRPKDTFLCQRRQSTLQFKKRNVHSNHPAATIPSYPYITESDVESVCSCFQPSELASGSGLLPLPPNSHHFFRWQMICELALKGGGRLKCLTRLFKWIPLSFKRSPLPLSCLNCHMNACSLSNRYFILNFLWNY